MTNRMTEWTLEGAPLDGSAYFVVSRVEGSVVYLESEDPINEVYSTMTWNYGATDNIRDKVGDKFRVIVEGTPNG